jgi:hypothetical protein
MIEGMQRALDVTFMETILVPIGGREFPLSPQSAPQLERVLNALYESNDSEVVEEAPEQKKKPWGSVLAKNFRDSFPVVAMMFGFDPKTPEGKEVVGHLAAYMAPKLAVRIYEEWRRINEIDDFLLRMGKPLLPPELVERLKELRIQEVEKILSESDPTEDRVLEATGVPVTE